MNCQQANETSIFGFLGRIGQMPKSVNGNCLWYKLRDEGTPSTKVDISLNRWFDYGAGKGGKLVDLVCFYFTNGDTKKALEMIGDNNFFLTPIERPDTAVNNNQTTIKKVCEIQHKALKDYLNERQIFDFYQDKLQEVHYTIGARDYFALGWQNDSGGWDLRNKLFKGCLLNKDITTIIGEVDNDVLDIWEGMFNFLSYLQYHDQPHKVIVLNSVANVNKAIRGIEKYKKVNLYLDNDKAGKEASELIKTIRNDVIDYSYICGNYTDYNEYLISESDMKV